MTAARAAFTASRMADAHLVTVPTLRTIVQRTLAIVSAHPTPRERNVKGVRPTTGAMTLEVGVSPVTAV